MVYIYERPSVHMACGPVYVIEDSIYSVYAKAFRGSYTLLGIWDTSRRARAFEGFFDCRAGVAERKKESPGLGHLTCEKRSAHRAEMHCWR